MSRVRKGVYEAVSSRTGLPTGKWDASVWNGKTNKPIAIGRFKSKAEAEAARQKYLEVVAKLGIALE